LPFLMTWHGSETGKDPNAPALAVHSHLSYHLHVGPTGRSSSTSKRKSQSMSAMDVPSSMDANPAGVTCCGSSSRSSAPSSGDAWSTVSRSAQSS
jgi:hypothetical protein